MKSNLHTLFATDKELEKEGKKIPLGEGVYFYLRRFGGANSALLKKSMSKHYAPFSKQIKEGIPLPEEVEDRLSARILVEVCVSNWEGVKDAEGNEVPFTPEAALEFLEELPDLVAKLMVYANDYNTYRQELGNS